MIDNVQYLRILRRRIGILLALPLVAGLTALVISSRTTPVYEATAVAFVPTANAVGGSGPSTINPLLVDDQVQTDADLLATMPTATAMAAAGLPRTPGEILASLRAARRPGTSLIDVSYRDRDPATALRGAATAVPAFNASLDKLQAEVSTNPAGTLLALVPWQVPTAAPTAPVSPRTGFNVVAAASVGLLLGLTLALALERPWAEVSGGLGEPLGQGQS